MIIWLPPHAEAHCCSVFGSPIGRQARGGSDEPCAALRSICQAPSPAWGTYLGVELASIVQECHADLLQTTDLTGVVLEALEDPTTDITRVHQAVLDIGWSGGQRHVQCQSAGPNSVVDYQGTWCCVTPRGR